MDNHLSTQEKRELRKELESLYPNKTLSESYLRAEKIITNSDSTLNFDIRKTGNERLTEKKLDQADVFVATHLGMYLMADQTAKIGSAVLQTYPNQTVFSAISGFVPTELETIYAGVLTIKSGPTVLVDAQEMLEFRRVPQTQQSASTNASMFEHGFGLKKLAGRIHMKGTQNTEVAVKFPTWSGITIANANSGFVNYLVFKPIGFLVKNAA